LYAKQLGAVEKNTFLRDLSPISSGDCFLHYKTAQLQSEIIIITPDL